MKKLFCLSKVFYLSLLMSLIVSCSLVFGMDNKENSNSYFYFPWLNKSLLEIEEGTQSVKILQQIIEQNINLEEESLLKEELILEKAELIEAELEINLLRINKFKIKPRSTSCQSSSNKFINHNLKEKETTILNYLNSVCNLFNGILNVMEMKEKEKLIITKDSKDTNNSYNQKVQNQSEGRNAIINEVKAKYNREKDNIICLINQYKFNKSNTNFLKEVKKTVLSAFITINKHMTYKCVFKIDSKEEQREKLNKIISNLKNMYNQINTVN